MKYRVLIEPDEDGVYVAEVPALPGCISQGRTRAEAVANIKEAIAAYLESLPRHGDPVPPPIFEEVVEVTVCASCRAFLGGKWWGCWFVPGSSWAYAGINQSRKR